MESEAISILKRAVELDKEKRYSKSLTLYQEGVKILLESAKETKDPAKGKHFFDMASKYLDRAEIVKKLIKTKKMEGTYRELLHIKDGSVGYGYNNLFGQFLDHTVTYIHIEDPYIRAFHQCQNLLRLCELAVIKCHYLFKITLITTRDPEDAANQSARLEELKKSLQSNHILFEVTYSETLHDRQIVLNNGWIIKIGRGLDYFKAPPGKFSLGFCDYELRQCQETTVDIFHKSHLREQ